MTVIDYDEFAHRAVHELMQLNSKYQEEFRIGSYGRYDYDLESGTLVFSNDGVPGVIAEIQVVGTDSTASKTWLWSRENASIPEHAKRDLSVVLNSARNTVSRNLQSHIGAVASMTGGK